MLQNKHASGDITWPGDRNEPVRSKTSKVSLVFHHLVLNSYRPTFDPVELHSSITSRLLLASVNKFGHCKWHGISKREVGFRELKCVCDILCVCDS